MGHDGSNIPPRQPDTITLALDRIGAIHVSWGYHNDLLAHSKLEPGQLEALQKKQAVYQIAEAIAEFIQWTPPQYIELTHVTTITGTVRVIKP